MEGQVPGGVPGVLPLVRHRDDVGVVEVRQSALRPCRRSGGGAGWPGRPRASARRRSGRTAWTRAARRTPGADAPRVLGRARPGCTRGVELVGLARRCGEDPRRSRGRTASPASPSSSRGAADRAGSPARDRQPVVRGGLGAPPLGLTVVRGRRRRSRRSPSLTYGPALGVAKSRSALVSFSVNSSSGAPSAQAEPGGRAPGARRCTTAARPAPRPAAGGARRVAAPTTRCCGTRASAAVQRRRLRPAVGDRDPDQDVVRAALAYSTSTSK